MRVTLTLAKTRNPVIENSASEGLMANSSKVRLLTFCDDIKQSVTSLLDGKAGRSTAGRSIV